MDKRTRILVSVASTIILVLGTVIGVLLVQGYTLDTKEKKVVQTGVLVVNSVPNGAQIWIDDHAQNVTNTSISYLPTKKYKIRLQKEGYTSWEKELDIDSKLITEIEAILWPATPSVNPITTTGAVNMKVSPDGLKVAYGIRFNEKDKAGLWVLDMAKRTVFSGTQSDFTQIARNTNALNFADADYTWSPDSNQLLVTLQENASPEARFQRNYILDITKLNTNPVDVTLTKENLMQTWYDDLRKRETTRLTKISSDAEGTKIASGSAIPIRWSWDNTMFIYAESTGAQTVQSPTSMPKVIQIKSTGKTATDSAMFDGNEATKSAQTQYKAEIESQYASFSASLKVKVYDTKKKKSFDLPQAAYYAWYPAEEKADREIQHLISIDKGSMSMIESDGSNKSTLYSGPFENGSVFPWPDGGRLVFMTNFNSGAGSEANLYTINLR